MSNPEAARLAALIRAAMKDQPLSDLEVQRRAEQLTAHYRRLARGRDLTEAEEATIRSKARAATLNSATLAARIEEHTGRVFPPNYVSRRLNAERPLITVHPDLYAFCDALGLDASVVVAEAILTRHGWLAASDGTDQT